ncbi:MULTISPECIES: DUF4145 domain-containing protein [unclassified Pseudoalteromonas]|uniref:DUF4145 domain-containing protein n=1 Tax=unclassified Pseudoalteromonas TaxID=194690 RepID=UPI0023590C52|nr:MULTISPECIES: SEC-C metal-binding domain-containing protein [unclassified Pseudoalteromonas]MDC9567145.1 SEC-C metal-binding domain-containing protein [Pseudoalteromonas sp. GAB2316C]MDC9571367.1 SEC-C metal-binding domain-containing protein [Pseudoalteromonas sp. GABNB9D]MDC9575665.1 SEC-C metal-binding domain-containing protein [Pseudoalteromonas sp. GABNS16A]MDC9579848.1 SEC-C metal-binding domain-containing protein [Pseudoalteromonas sp. GABNS16E]MDC9587591.1 SEC-C metal-binding domain-
MSTPLTDIQFVSKFNTSFAERYEKAKNLYFDAPIQTLVELRGLLALLCDEIIAEYLVETAGNNLNDKVNGIKASNQFRLSIIDYMHKVREAGNKGAHPEKYQISYPEYQKLALETLQTFCTLIEDYWVGRTSKVPAYEFTFDINSPVKEWCYQALFNSDKNAKFELGMALFYKYQEQFEGDDKFYIDQSPLMKSIDFIEEAASEFHPEALFEYSHILLNGIHRDKDIEKAKGYLYNSANRGFTKSKIAFGQLIYECNEPHVEDIEEVIRFLEEAATDGEDQAQFLLSQIYATSKFGLKNDAQSSQWFEKSIKSGNANAIFMQASATLNSSQPTPKDVRQSLKGLELAIEGGSRDAHKLYLKIFNESAHSVATVRPLYDDYLERYPDDYQRHLDLTEYLFRKGSDGNDINLMREAIEKLIQLARFQETPTKLKRRLNLLSPKWLAKYDQVIRRLGVLDKAHAELLMQFKPDGTPYDDFSTIGEMLKKIHTDPKLVAKLFYTGCINKSAVSSVAVKQGRNSGCSCGSGLKFKKCCG